MIPIKLYLTDEDYEIAELNGINPSTLRGRIDRGWDKQRAITESTIGKRAKWLRVAKVNGIKEGTFNNRVYTYGYTHEEAATKQLFNGYYTELLKKARERGNPVAYSTIQQRISKGMSEEEAISKFPQTTNKRKSDIDRILDVEVKSPHSQWF